MATNSTTLASYESLRDALQTAIDESAGGPVVSYEINGRKVTLAVEKV